MVKGFEVDDGIATTYRACPPWYLRLAATAIVRWTTGRKTPSRAFTIRVLTGSKGSAVIDLPPVAR